jgi:hypothetical protein
MFMHGFRRVTEVVCAVYTDQLFSIRRSIVPLDEECPIITRPPEPRRSLII